MTSWADAPTIHLVAASCPFCGALRPATMRSDQNGDGSVTRLSVCRQCDGRFKIVIEPPDDHPHADMLNDNTPGQNGSSRFWKNAP